MPDPESFQVVVRFNEDLGLPYRDGIEADLARALPDDWPGIAAKFPRLHFRRVFEVDNPRGTQKAARQVAQRAAQAGDENAPAPFFVAEVPDAKQAKDLVRRLARLRKVEEAFIRSRPTAADDTGTEPVPDHQRYLDPAPMGIGARAVWDSDGGRGEGATILDLERGWDLGHEDLPPRLRDKVLFGENREDKGHGTSVLGILVGRHDHGRIKGVAPDANILLASYLGPKGPDVAAAIHRARTTTLKRGDILLLECVMQTPPGKRPQFLKAPAEVDPDVLDEIRSCTAMGILVVEPAGNDGKSLSKLDLVDNYSGALMVGAAAHTEGGLQFGKRPECSCNYGERVDCFAWGHEIATLEEGGKLRAFGKTSGAAAIIAGAAALVQSIARRHRDVPLTPAEIRHFLTTIGTRTKGRGYKIGMMPDLIEVQRWVSRRPWALGVDEGKLWKAAVRKK